MNKKVMWKYLGWSAFCGHGRSGVALSRGQS